MTGEHKALTALRKGISGSYVILFLPTITDVCLSHFSTAVNECKGDIYLIQQHPPACDQKLKKTKIKTNPEKAIGLLTAWTAVYFLCDLLKFRGESFRLTNGNKTVSRQTSLANRRPPQGVRQINLTSPLLIFLAISSCTCSLQDQVKQSLCGKRRTS